TNETSKLFSFGDKEFKHTKPESCGYRVNKKVQVYSRSSDGISHVDLYSVGHWTCSVTHSVSSSSTLVSVEIATGNEHADASHLEQSEAEYNPETEDTGVADTTTTIESTGSEGAEETTEPETEETTVPTEPTAPPAPVCDVSSVTTTLAEKIEQLEGKVDSLVSQLTSKLETKVGDLKESISQISTATSSSSDDSQDSDDKNGNGKVAVNFDGCVKALANKDVDEALKEWEAIEALTLGPTAKSTLLKDILFLAYDSSKGTVVKFVQELINASKKFLPSVYDVLQESMKLNSDNIFALAHEIKSELGVDSNLYSKLPLPVREITSGKIVTLTYLCKTLQKKLEVHVRDDEMTWQREYWPVVASSTYDLNHTKGAMWTFEGSSDGHFKVKNSWFGDYLWIEPNYQNLRTVDESTKNRNGTEFKLKLSTDDTVTIHSVFYKNAPVVEGYLSRNTRDVFRPLRVDADHLPIKFNVELATTKPKN
ncbi:unnamed protein product, partial [Allacma fusca]